MFWPSSKEGQGVNVLKPNQRATVITLLERSTPQREIVRITLCRLNFDLGLEPAFMSAGSAIR
jgi:hypothetical protein